MIMRFKGQVLQARELPDQKTGQLTPVLDMLFFEAGKKAETIAVYARDHKIADLKALEGKHVTFTVWASVKSLSLQPDALKTLVVDKA